MYCGKKLPILVMVIMTVGIIGYVLSESRDNIGECNFETDWMSYKMNLDKENSYININTTVIIPGFNYHIFVKLKYPINETTSEEKVQKYIDSLSGKKEKCIVYIDTDPILTNKQYFAQTLDTLPPLTDMATLIKMMIIFILEALVSGLSVYSLASDLEKND